LKSKDLVGKNFRTGKGEDTISSGLEGAWVLRLQSGVTTTLRIFSDLNGS
jgi:catalase (peroxidase I)